MHSTLMPELNGNPQEVSHYPERLSPEMEIDPGVPQRTLPLARSRSQYATPDAGAAAIPHLHSKCNREGSVAEKGMGAESRSPSVTIVAGGRLWKRFFSGALGGIQTRRN